MAQLQKTTLFITHDLDEAIRIGHRTAIMEGGVIVQIGRGAWGDPCVSMSECAERQISFVTMIKLCGGS